MKQFDLISDIHLDFWVKSLRKSNESQLEIIQNFANSILPDEISNVLVIAGDLGHDNNQNFEFLKCMKTKYKYILLVAGNHDYYLENSTARFKYKKASILRWNEMKSLGHSLEGIHYLEGEKITINGTTFGGTGMWYDFSYGIQVLNQSVTQMLDAWNNGMNDEKYIFGSPRRPLDWFYSEKKRLEDIIFNSDVIITHVGPDWSRIPNKYKLDKLTGCYYFDGQEYLKQCEGKIWCFGHAHYHYSYIKQGCWLINNALGYPNEKNVGTTRIVNIPLESGFYG